MNFLEAMQFRHACKRFDPAKKVSANDQDMIIEFGRLSPSSFGLEPWHFFVINDLALREKIRPACWDQPQITESSFVVLYLSCLPHHFRHNSLFMRQRISRRSQNEEQFQAAEKRITQHLAEQNTPDWAKRQTYLALANMITGAASLGIDSCPIEGFFLNDLKTLLQDKIDWTNYDLVALAAFGYRAGEQSKRYREPTSSICTIY
jgi:nitroreductase